MIVAEDVHVHFRRGLIGSRIKALDGLSLEVRDGDFFALVGQNGAGKSTAMYCFLGLLRPASGRVRVSGEAPQPGSKLFSTVGYLPEEPHYHLYLTVEGAVRYYASLYGQAATAKQVSDALDRLGLGPFKSLPLAKCSKGMKQKVGIAQCLIHETRLLFLDEPTRGLDPIIVMQFREVLRELHRKGTTIVMNTHVLSEVEMLANRVAIIERGKVIAQDTLEHLLKFEQVYNLVFEAGDSLPDYVRVDERRDHQVKGSVPADRLFEFMEFARASGARVLECSLKKTTLEESFFEILKGSGSRTADAHPQPSGGPTGSAPKGPAPEAS